jgi:hypothetical protein
MPPLRADSGRDSMMVAMLLSGSLILKLPGKNRETRREKRAV